MNTILSNRFRLLPYSFLLTALFAVPLMPGQQTSGAEQHRPNILFMLTDDQRFDDLGCIGNPVVQTPNLDRLAADGVLFENAFATTAICCSSRASILTGQHMWRHGIRDFHTPLSADAMDPTLEIHPVS